MSFFSLLLSAIVVVIIIIVAFRFDQSTKFFSNLFSGQVFENFKFPEIKLPELELPEIKNPLSRDPFGQNENLTQKEIDQQNLELEKFEKQVAEKTRQAKFEGFSTVEEFEIATDPNRDLLKFNPEGIIGFGDLSINEGKGVKIDSVEGQLLLENLETQKTFGKRKRFGF